MAIPIPAPSLTDQTSFGSISASFGAVNYQPPPLAKATASQALTSSVLPLAVGAVVVAAVIYYKWGR